jgi:DNA-binding NtrC family response regulator
MKKEDLKDIPFILVTSNTGIEDVKKAMQEGIKNYMLKPFDIDTLEKTINAVLK